MTTSFSPLRGVGAGVVDYRLARRGLISEVRKGRMSTTEVCDAHPELLRAATSYSRPTSDLCPICEAVELVHVTYVFGPQLPACGRCVATLEELVRLAERSAGSVTAPTCYVVEVCVECRWNHLVQVFPLAGRRRA